jgi:hypothetical protein
LGVLDENAVTARFYHSYFEAPPSCFTAARREKNLRSARPNSFHEKAGPWAL